MKHPHVFCICVEGSACMRKPRQSFLLASILFTTAVSLIMLDPGAVSLAFVPSPTEVTYITFSYYALTPLGYGNPLPFLSAYLAIFALIIGVIAYFRPSWKCGMFVFLICSFMMSILTVFFSKQFSVIGIVVSGLLICAIILLGIQINKANKNRG